MLFGDLPGGTVDKKLPANAGDAGSIPGVGRSYMPWSNYPCAATAEHSLWSLEAAAAESVSAAEPVPRNDRNHHSGKTAHCNEQEPLTRHP